MVRKNGGYAKPFTHIQSKAKVKENSMYHAYSLLANKKTHISHLPSLRGSIEVNNSAIEEKHQILINTLESGSRNKNFHLHKMQTKTELFKEIDFYLKQDISPSDQWKSNEDIKSIQLENLQIFAKLKIFNGLLTRLLAYKRDRKAHSKNPEKQNISTEILIQKEENYEKWLKYYKTEYEQLAQRIKKLEDSSYLEILTCACTSLNKKINKLRGTIENGEKDHNLFNYVKI